MADGQPPHSSPPGTWEAIYKSVLEDRTLTDSEARLISYLVTKPDGWILHARQLARDLGRTESWARTAVKRLRRRGLVEDQPVRTADGRRITRWDTRFRRNLVAAFSTPPDSVSVDVICGNGARENPHVAESQVTSTPADSGGVEPPEKPKASSHPPVKPQVTSTHPVLYPGREHPPIREDGLSREDGQLPSEDSPAAPLRSAAVDAQPSRLEENVTNIDGSLPLPGVEVPPPKPATAGQRAKALTDAYAAREPMCKWPAVNQIVRKAIKAGRWRDMDILAALIRLADARRPVTVAALQVELDGRAKPRYPRRESASAMRLRAAARDYVDRATAADYSPRAVLEPGPLEAFCRRQRVSRSDHAREDTAAEAALRAEVERREREAPPVLRGEIIRDDEQPRKGIR